MELVVVGRLMTAGDSGSGVPVTALRDRAGVPLRTRGGEFILTR